MTEAEWLACDCPYTMLEFLQWKADHRKLRLFACACCRRNENIFAGEGSVITLRVAELYADGLATGDQLSAAAEQLSTDVLGADPDRPLADPAYGPPSLNSPAFWAAHTHAPEAARSVRDAAEEIILINVGEGAARAEYVAQRVTLRDIFGNPFRPFAFAPEWRTSTAVAIAQGMYESRDFSAMPILADALQDAGCDNADILNHCRDEKGVHVRGCWVVDLVLGKE
jgi:hypothetical protein